MGSQESCVCVGVMENRRKKGERAAHANRKEKRAEEALVRDPDFHPAFYVA